jgi:uncharacterized protein (DUF58 family)
MKFKKYLVRQLRKREQVYIFPTKMGGYLIGLIFLMFLLAVGYSNNLLLIFTLFLFTFNLLWLVQTHFHLARFKLVRLLISEGHARVSLPFSVKWPHLKEALGEINLTLVSQNEEEYDLVENTLNLPRRGPWRWSFLKISSTHPFGLYFTWKYLPLDLETIVYPELMPLKIVDATGLYREGDIPQEKSGVHDFRELIPYEGSEVRKISWKHYARSGEILMKDGYTQSEACVNLFLPEKFQSKELELSKLASQMVYCHRHNVPFSFQGPGFHWGPDQQGDHLRKCLRILATC